MAQKVATPKQTSGGGFSFENKVATYYAVKMFLGDNPFVAEHGRIIRIDFQTRVKGWLLDDILLTLESDGRQKRISLSVKSNPQFTKTSAPIDFVQAVWAQILHEESDIFDFASDMLGLVTSCQPEPQKRAIQEVLNFAKTHNAGELEKNLNIQGYTSRKVRALFESFKCPITLTNLNTNNLGPADILRHLYVIEFDFENDVSDSENLAISSCQSLLKSSSRQEAQKLWHSMLEIVNSRRIAGGYIDKSTLVKELRSFYDLKDFPDYAGDWEALRVWSNQNIDVVPTRIAGTLLLPREKQKKELSDKFEKSKVMTLLGASGVGKTVLAKLHAEEFFKSDTVIWVGSDKLKKGQIFEVNTIAGLGHPLTEVLSNFTGSRGLVVFDRLERLRGEDDFQELQKLLNAIDFDDGPWKLLITCRSEHWQRIQADLRKFNGIQDFELYSLGYLEKEELGVVWKAFPQIQNLALRAQLGQLIKIPKIIDLIATRLQSKQSVEGIKWVGETDLINWLWEFVQSSCDEGYPLIVFIQNLAELQADEGNFVTSITRYQPQEISCLEALKQEGICTESNGQISFQHDLFGDWARYRNILANETNIDTYLRPKFLNPFWQKAIRLYGLYLIEQKTDINEWRNAINQYDFIKDYLLDSVIFAANSKLLLEKVYFLLVANKGELLKRLLKRFLIIATFPNPSHVTFASTIGKDYLSLARTLDRIPFWIYWPSIITFLLEHKDDLLGLVPSEIAEIAKTWLRWTPPEYPLRKEAARLAVAVGNATYNKRKSHPYSTRDEQDKLKYSATLSAALELPDEVVELALMASGRIIPDDVASGEVGDYKKPGSKTTVYHHGFSLSGEVPEPWPDGPKNRVDDAFQKTCLFTDSLLSLMIKRPEAVKEVILALIIDLRKPKREYDDYHWSDRDIELQHLHEFWPGGWHKGPFLNFLRYNQEHGLDTIIRLVDFATKRLLENKDFRSQNPIELVIDNKTKRFTGSGRIYNWYRGDVSCADVIASALMALEKYLYEQIDKKQDVKQTLKQILIQSESIAFLGLACEIGRYRPQLFAEVLRPLLSIAELYLWEDFFGIQNASNSIRFSMEPIEIRKIMLDWEKMSHRSTRLIDVAAFLFLNDPSMKEFFESFKYELEQRFKSNPDEGEITEKIKTLVAAFDRKNWKETKLSSNKGAWQYFPPKPLREEAEATLVEIREKQKILCFPAHCRRLLDKEISLKDSEVESFWQQVKKLGELPHDKYDRDILTMTIDGVAGGIAVLLKHRYECLEVHPNYRNWCIKQLVNIIKHPPPREQFDIPTTAGNIYWDSFISEVAPILWSEEPDSKQWRELIAELVCLRHYNSMSLLMKSSYQLRSKLGNSFFQLVNLVLLHATIGNQLRRYFEPDTKESNKEYKKKAKQIRACKKRFVNGTLSYDVSTWALDLINKTELISFQPRRGGIRIRPKGIDSNLHENDLQHIYRKRPNVDLLLISSSFKDIFSIEDAKDVSEQIVWLQFWEQALNCRLAFIRCFDEKGDVLNVDEYEAEPCWMSDDELLPQIAKFVVRLKNSEDASRLWKPIMELGPSAHYFIEYFLSWFFLFGFGKDYDEGFITVWKDILEYFNSSKLWYLNKTTMQGHHIYEVWQYLLGINPRVHFSYNERHQKTIKEMADYYQQWAKDNLALDTYATMYFSELLRKPVANLIRLEAIIWIKDAANKASEWWWKEEGLLGSLAELLSISWEEHKMELAKNKNIDMGFKELLQLLVNKQHPVAIDLQARLVEHN